MINDLPYRKEVDGLRAIAVLAVILFHAEISWCAGGYVGVDVFFVISGYLITYKILHEKENGDFSLIDFYDRRARRILPALTVVLFATTVAGFILLPPNLLKDYSKSLKYVAVFYSNVFFYRKIDYFSTAIDEKPLLHTWSLAVEEQYYILFPILFIVLWVGGKRLLITFFVMLSITSLLVSYLLINQNFTNANFYLISSRAWELLFGSIVAFCIDRLFVQKWLKEWMGIVGLLMIIYSIVFFSKQTTSPSFYTLIPVLGACFVVIFTDETVLAGRILSNKLLVSIGLLSYSLYLWHQPVFAFLRIKTIGKPTFFAFLVSIILIFIFSYFSWKFVERPFKNRQHFSKPYMLLFSVSSIVLFATFGVLGDAYDGFAFRFKTSSYTDSIVYSPKRLQCHTSGERYLEPSEACRYFNNNVTWASLGDSHVVELSYAIAKRIEKNGYGILHLSFSGCSPALMFDSRTPGCAEWLRKAVTYIEKEHSIKNVLLGFRHSVYLHGDQLDVYPDLPDADPANVFTDSFRSKVTEAPEEIYWQSFHNIVERLLKSGKTVYVLYPIPELPVHISEAVTPFHIFTANTFLDLEYSTTSAYYFNRHKFILNKLDTLQYNDQLRAIKPFEILCHTGYCPTIDGKKALYFDDDHLSLWGAEKMVRSAIFP